MARTVISGPYNLLNVGFLRQQAVRDDPRNVFYAAMLKHRTYEAYLAEVGSVGVEVPNNKMNPITGRAEILYARRNGWVVDSPKR